MKFELLHPADRLVIMMDRIYRGGMTTTSGGNLSVRDDDGDIWITPTGIDKGSLSSGDICRVRPDGTVLGPYEPSMELPFHASIYRRRPDIRAVLHAHPPALVAFSAVRVLPDVNLVANTRQMCERITMAKYAVPGSSSLGDNIAAEFQKGSGAVLLENHGVAVGAENLSNAFMVFETLEFTAALEINSRRLGKIRSLQESEIDLAAAQGGYKMDDFVPEHHGSDESAARQAMIALIRRSYRQKLFGSTHGTCSARLPGDSFLITPHGIDRACLEEEDLVLIKRGMKEQGKAPSRSARLHQLIYEKNPDIRSIIGASPPHAMAFAVTGNQLDTRTIPESYIMLRSVQKVPFSEPYLNPQTVAGMFSAQNPVLICDNSQILVTGNSLLNAFDRLEVTEATAHSILSARDIGKIIHISDAGIEDINAAFHLND